jgi:hypothetical protein
MENLTWEVAKKCEKEVYEKVSAAAGDEEDAEGRDCEKG